MNFTCPHCQHQSRINKPKAGRFKPKCPKCQKPFILVIDNAGKVHIRLVSDPASEEKSPASKTAPESRNDSGPKNTPPNGMTAAEADSKPSEAGTKSKASSSPTTSRSPQEARPDTGGDEEAKESTKATGPSVDPGELPTSELERTALDTSPTSADPVSDAEISAAEISQEFDTVAFEQQATEAGADRSDQPTTDRAPATENSMPKRLGGYRLEKQLGQGGMGTVYLAKQLSLDRNVAIKILSPKFTRNPSFVSRFVREAYAAAQLVHHNVVQIYDIGSQGDIHYFSMELVKGDSLHGLIRRQRRLDCDTAAGYVLQAARGLKFAHDQGMVHRDVKPANLMLDEHGTVKVADLGLVKLGGSQSEDEVAENLDNVEVPKDTQITQLGVSVGTPTYMAPEQWKRSSEVDQRADIYSLGCTFYVMVTGKLPFDGRTPKEVVTKVISEQAIPPNLIVKDIPKRISSIVNRMIAKEPSDRYPDMAALISDLEEYLGVSSSGAFSPSERHVEILEKSVEEYNQNRLVSLRRSLFQVGFSLVTLLFVVGFFFSPRFALTVAATTLSTGVSYFLIRGAIQRTHLFTRLKDYLFSNQLWDWVTMGLTGIVMAVLVYFMLGITGTLVMLILGPLLGASLFFGLDRSLAIRRKPAIVEAEKLFRVLRLRGLNEDLLRQFVCKFSGNQWEEFFEELFGYEAKIVARNWLKGETGKRRSTFRWWRDPLIRWIEHRAEIREQARQVRVLEKVELQKLLAQGIEKAEAKIRARNIAKLMTENAEAWRQSQVQENREKKTIGGADATEPQTQQKSRPTLSNLSRNLDEKLLNRGPKVTLVDRFHGYINLVIGARTRFLLGVVLFGLCLWWLQKNGKIDALKQSGSALTSLEIVFSQNAYDADGEVRGKTEPVGLVFLPESWLAVLNNLNHGVIGLILIGSAMTFGWLVTVPVVLGGAIAVVGPQLGILPADGILMLSAENLCLIAGALVAIVGCYFLKPSAEA